MAEDIECQCGCECDGCPCDDKFCRVCGCGYDSQVLALDIYPNEFGLNWLGLPRELFA